MKSRLIWAAVLVAAMVGFYFATIRPAIEPTPTRLRGRINAEFRPPEIPPPEIPVPKFEIPALPPPALPTVLPPVMASRPRSPLAPPEVPIQNGTTIDFSTGSPVIRSQGADKEALDRALREMADAVKDVSFGPEKKTSNQ